MEKQKLNYLMVLFGLVFMTMTTLPGFIPSVEFVAQLVGGITKVAGVALLVTGIVLNIGNWKGVMPIPFIVVAGVAALVTILSMIPFIGYVFTWIAFIVSIVTIASIAAMICSRFLSEECADFNNFIYICD